MPTTSAARQLPSEFAIFPLAGAVLLPGGRLPLNIFEPRYLAMTQDSLRGERLIGMVQPNDPQDDNRGPRGAANPPVYPIGCAGRVTQFSETDDGRFLITLTGVLLFAAMVALSQLALSNWHESETRTET